MSLNKTINSCPELGFENQINTDTIDSQVIATQYLNDENAGSFSAVFMNKNLKNTIHEISLYECDTCPPLMSHCTLIDDKAEAYFNTSTISPVNITSCAEIALTSKQLDLNNQIFHGEDELINYIQSSVQKNYEKTCEKPMTQTPTTFIISLSQICTIIISVLIIFFFKALLNQYYDNNTSNNVITQSTQANTTIVDEQPSLQPLKTSQTHDHDVIETQVTTPQHTIYLTPKKHVFTQTKIISTPRRSERLRKIKEQQKREVKNSNT